MNTIKAYGAKSATSNLEPLTIQRRELLPSDVKIDILYCGVCHSDIHTARNDWKSAKYPVVPGHEIVGKVVAIGEAVKNFKIGDKVGVGCLVDACRECNACHEDLEQYCENGNVGTYNGVDKHLGGHTFGGYAQEIVVDEHFVLRIPDNLDLAKVAPLLCAGITTYSPLNHWNIQKGDKVGVIGLGGLGHMGIKLAKAMGAHVVMITTSPEKGKDAQLLGADEVVISTNEAEMRRQKDSFDFLLNTIPVRHKVDAYLRLLKRDATMVLVGAIEEMDTFHGGLLIGKRKNIAGSLIGGIKETQEMLDFCAAYAILPETELIAMDSINEAWERVVKNDIKYRFVIDMKTLK